MELVNYNVKQSRHRTISTEQSHSLEVENRSADQWISLLLRITKFHRMFKSAPYRASS